MASDKTVISALNGLSKALLLLVASEAMIGFGLSLAYHATPDKAYSSVSQIRSQAVGLFAASFHYWGSSLLIVVSLVTLAIAAFSGLFRRDPLAWYASIVLFLAALGLQITGNLLPFDHHGVQTAVVEGGIAGSVPVIGGVVHRIALSGNQFSPATLSFWYMLHGWPLGLAALLAAATLSFRFGKLAGKSSPMIAMWWPAGFLVFCLASLAMYVPAPRGSAATDLDYSSFGAHVSWYTWSLHGLLSGAEKLDPTLGWLGAIAWPTLTLLWLLLLPLTSRKLTKTTSHIALLLLAAPFVICGVLFAGPVASLVGNRDPGVAVAQNQPETTTKSKPVTKAELLAGQQLFNKVGCSDCHGTNGVNGDSGPQLDQKYRQHPDAAYFVRYIRNPKAVSSSSTMPAFPNLPQEQVEKIAVWLANPR